jgi:hypothetical protein
MNEFEKKLKEYLLNKLSEEYLGYSKEEIDKLEDFNGIYVIFDGEDICYVGESFTQNMKKRLVQNLIDGDNGGTLRKNIAEIDKIKVSSAVTKIKKLKFKYLKLDISAWAFACDYERIYISLFQPKYNKSKKKKYSKDRKEPK